MKSIILFCVLLLAAIPAKADEAPIVIELTPGVFIITQTPSGTSVQVIDGLTLVSMEITNTGAEPLFYGDHGANSGGATGSCSTEFYLGATAYPVCEEFSGASGFIQPGETFLVPFMYLTASTWVAPGFEWQEDIHLTTSAGVFDSSFTGRIVDPPTVTTPEPASLLLLGTGLVGLAARLRRRMTR